ncbi:kinase-like domain-containing protein [Mycena polygramma]|nr:kinase-like domain-containing protein [Mycena polygramma]
MSTYGRNREYIADIELELHNLFLEHPDATITEDGDPVIPGDALVYVFRAFADMYAGVELLTADEMAMLHQLIGSNPGMQVTPQVVVAFIAEKAKHTPPLSPPMDEQELNDYVALPLLSSPGSGSGPDCVQTWARDVDIHDICQRLADLFHENRESYHKFLSCRGDAAQKLLDLLQNLLDCDSNLPSPMRRRLFKALIRLSSDSKLHPKCFTLTGLQRGQLVAGGSFSDVYKGLLEGQYVAVKMMRVFEGSDIEALLKEFGREALIWRQLYHPNLLPFFGLYYLDHRLCLVAPWMEGGHIRAFLKRETCDTSRRVSFILDVALGLEYLHEQNVVHADLKGENIFVTPSGRACIADFGLSSIMTSKSSFLFGSSSKQSHGGTARYQAPELLRGSRNNLSSDIYAFACLAYELLTGTAPFPELPHDIAVFTAVLGGRRPSRPESCSGSSSLDELWNLLQSCWEEEPEMRPTAADLVKRLMGPDIQAKSRPSPADWDKKFTSRFRRQFLGEWYLPSVAELDGLFIGDGITG